MEVFFSSVVCCPDFATGMEAAHFDLLTRWLWTSNKSSNVDTPQVNRLLWLKTCHWSSEFVNKKPAQKIFLISVGIFHSSLKPHFLNNVSWGQYMACRHCCRLKDHFIFFPEMCGIHCGTILSESSSINKSTQRKLPSLQKLYKYLGFMTMHEDFNHR